VIESIKNGSLATKFFSLFLLILVEALLYSLPPCCLLYEYGFAGVDVNTPNPSWPSGSHKDVFVVLMRTACGALSLH